MKQKVKDEAIRFLIEEGREAAIEFLLGWMIGLSYNKKFATRDDILFILEILNYKSSVPSIDA